MNKKPASSDKTLQRFVAGTIATAAIMSIFCVTMLSVMGRDIPQILVAVSSATVGALVGVFVPSPNA